MQHTPTHHNERGLHSGLLAALAAFALTWFLVNGEIPSTAATSAVDAQTEAVIQHAHGEIARLRTHGREAHFLTLDGQDTARLMYAYGKLTPPSPPALTTPEST